MKLYHSSGSPNSRRVRILIAEKGLDIELAPVDLGAKEQFSNAYRAINPRVVVPTLMLDDGIANGDVLLVDRVIKSQHGHVVIAVVDGELMCRRLHKQRGVMKLEAAGPGHPDIVPGEGAQLEVWGVVTTVIKSLFV